MSHTPEPWELIHQHGLLDIVVNREEAVVICTSVTPANARRIVACVNACVGTTTSDLEQIANHGGWNHVSADWKLERERVEQQRDELLTAAQSYYWHGEVAERELVAAIAKARRQK